MSYLNGDGNLYENIKKRNDFRSLNEKNKSDHLYDRIFKFFSYIIILCILWLNSLIFYGDSYLVKLSQCLTKSIFPPQMTHLNNHKMSVPSHVSDKKTVDESELLLDKQKEHHIKSFEIIKKALILDEETDDRQIQQKIPVIELYKSGIRELENGIELDISEFSGDRWDRARKLQCKMRKNHAMVKERLQKLESENSGVGYDKTVAEQLMHNIEIKNEKTQLFKAKMNLMSTIRKAFKKSPKEAKSPKIKIGLNTDVQLCNKLSLNKRVLPKNTSNGNRLPITPPRVRRNIPNNTPPHASASKPRVTPINSPTKPQNDTLVPKKLVLNIKGVDKAFVEAIMDEIYDYKGGIDFNSVSGHEIAKQALRELVIYPTLRPEIFTGLRSPPKGLLLFGPPGNGKTMIAKAVATESKATFLNISASSLTSKWLGDGEKLVRALFAVARELQPTIIFIDEVDSLLSVRKENEHDATRRLKTQFFIEFDGLNSTGDERILVMGATNRPNELDDAALRRFSKRIYITLPNFDNRIGLLTKLMKQQKNTLSKVEMEELANATEGYSASDLTALAKDASLGPIRELAINEVINVNPNKMRKITADDFRLSLKRIRKSVAPSALDNYEKWNQEYGDTSL